MIAIVCSLLTAACFYFSTGLGEQWYLAWFAALPVLWLAFGPTRRSVVFFAAWAGAAAGACSLLRAYAGVLPASVVALEIGVPSLFFAIAVSVARTLYFRYGALLGALAFATVWTAFDFLISFGKGGGAIATPAAAEMAVPALVQSLALVGFTGITFLLGFVPAGIAAALRSGRRAPLLVALGLFVANLAFGYWHMSTPPVNTLRVALMDGDKAVGAIGSDDQAAAERVVDGYLSALDAAHVKAQLIVLPENIAYLASAWREAVFQRFAAAASRHNATIVAGFNSDIVGGRGNLSFAFIPGQDAPVIYQKRALVPVFETEVFKRGSGPAATPSGIGLEVCKDMDFQGMLRRDEIATQPSLLAVPAWDFNRDDWFHARVAIMRSVENGVPMARSARNGLMTLNDRYGRLLLKVRSQPGITLVSGELPLSGSGGATPYDVIGDAFGWLALLAGLLFVALCLRTPERKEGVQAERVASATSA